MTGKEAEMTIGVVGAGTMGVGVAQCAAQAGHDVVVVEPDPAARERGPQRLREGVRLLRLTRPTAPVGPTGTVWWAASIDALAAADFVVECVVERVDVKRVVLSTLDAICPARTVLASCTSAIPVARLAAFTRRADRVLAMHFMNPAPLKDAVEVVRGADTSPETLDRARALLDGMGKRAIVVNDGPGFVTNRVLMLTVNEAATVVGQGTADAATVDDVFTSCFGHPLGPLATADLIGLDTVLDSLVVLREHTGDDRFTPSALLTELVDAGHLGRKAGRGFHHYAHTRVL
ncbi:3-hydroxyacyl-CoA dehydrogenase family protein [Micromonospora sp. WMMD1155]|uniref:3-hydroxyacyl-CoA dehydrogenase family protein n=1 Tax=Micromonospora sp. WMMD1155 TaxID=3016094 RepID=UPI00249BCCBA|nr:3-hydroxyacyl-CoA dehydrogenase family protein [Micromonospora sp. WMMD1155]WFE54788.1 3-hydroxyacyl-CoA dehydrogenase family protein [Micromonospora sp. WMMD1155]